LVGMAGFEPTTP